MGPNTTLLIGTLVPNSGNTMNGLLLPGKDIAKTSYNWPTLAVAPRFGFAYDISGNQKFVLRGGGGLFYDRLNGNTVFGTAANPPALQNVSVSNGQLQTLGTSGLTSFAPPSLTVFSYDNPLPTSFQWNIGVQRALPWAIVGGRGVRRGPQLQSGHDDPNINNIDLGTTFLPSSQDPTVTPTLLGLEHRADRSAPHLPRIREHQPASVDGLERESLAAVGVHAPLPARAVVRLQ